MTVEIYVGLLLLLAILFFVLRPLWQAHHRQQVATPTEAGLRLENLLFRREALLQGLRDLQLDVQSGKLMEEEFVMLDAQLRAEAVDVLQQLDALGEPALPGMAGEESLDQWIEQAVASVRARPRERSAAAPLTDQQRSEPA